MSLLTSRILDGNWQVPHSLALFEETDVLCVADREGGRVECVQAGLQKPLHANRDDTGRRVVNYNSRQIGRPYAIAAKGTALLVLRGSPGAKGLTIDTAAEPEEEPIIDEWATSDVSILTHFFPTLISREKLKIFFAEKFEKKHWFCPL